MKQDTFTDIEYSLRKKKTNRAYDERWNHRRRNDHQCPQLHEECPKSLPQVSDNAIDWGRYIENRKSSVRCK